MDNPETLAIMSTKDTGGRQTKHQITTQHRKLKKDEQHRPHQKPGVNSSLK